MTNARGARTVLRAIHTARTTTTKTGVEMIAAERDRQQNVEGYDTTHDIVANRDGSLALAAATYALSAEARTTMPRVSCTAPITWPWHSVFWKPTPDDRIRELVKAGALIAAEIDRLTAEEAAR